MWRLCGRATVGRARHQMRARMHNLIPWRSGRGRRGRMRAGMNHRGRLRLVLRRRWMCCYRQRLRLALRRPMGLLRRRFAMGRRVPRRDVSLFTRSFIWRVLPPIRGPWMVMMPNNHLALMPVAIVIEPNPHRPSNAERDIKPIWCRRSFDINDFGTINRDVDDIPHSRSDYNGPSLDIYDLLRRGIEIAEGPRLGAQPLHCIHNIDGLIQE